MKIASGILTILILITLLLVPTQALADDYEYGVIVTSDGETECRLLTFEGAPHFQPINPENGGLIPEMNAKFPNYWLTLTLGNYRNNPSGSAIACWLGSSWAEVIFEQPVCAVSFYYASRVSVTLEAYNELGELLLSTSGPATNPTGSFDNWQPLSVMLGENTIAQVVIIGGAAQTAIDDFKACRILILGKADVLNQLGIPGKGISTAPGLEKPFNDKSQAADHIGSGLIE